MTRFEQTCARLAAKHAPKPFIAPTGDAFIDAFNKGDKFRVKVRRTYESGHVEERWGYVSITGGWQPAFLLMRRRGQHGSSDVLCHLDTIIDTRYLP